MRKTEYPALGETVYRTVLPSGLTVAVVPRRGFSKKMAYFVTDYGAVHTRYRLDGRGKIFSSPAVHSSSMTVPR